MSGEPGTTRNLMISTPSAAAAAACAGYGIGIVARRMLPPAALTRHRRTHAPVPRVRPGWLSGGLAGQPDRTAGADRQVVAGGQGRGQGIELRDVTRTELVL